MYRRELARPQPRLPGAWRRAAARGGSSGLCPLDY
jgi:hypothetical protein